jgi:addiction module HigA family antidote
MIPKNRPPTHPGVILEEEFLKPLGMTQVALAKKLAVPIQRINTIVTGKRGVTADTALLLAEVFDTSPEFWMNLQNRVDLWVAKKERAKKVG